ncbi:MAG: hypothetical protein GTO40_18195 [Deltaproteobacteria bacterium]|nr:hypothetical protein [Deltaproteobacteria bacterium]
MLVNFRNPVVIVTKNHLVTRDLDLLTELTRYQAAAVFISITTLDNDLARRMEPRASQPELRFQAIHSLSQAGVPTGVMVAPVIPGLTDHELPSIVEKAKLAGAQSASYVMLRLPFAVKHLFEDWLTTHFPERKEKILNRIRAIRGGQLNDPQFKTRMKGEGIFAEQIASLFAAACRKAGISNARPTLSTSSFRRIQENQLQLFP